jgi:hypothetical protein
LWIDAICIDQTSFAERNHQVSLINHIYSIAACVIVWLGLSDEVDVVEHDRLLPSLNWGAHLHLKSPATWTPILVDCMQILCKRDYWTRIWIIQEFVLAQKVEVWLGDDILDGTLTKINQLVEFATQYEVKRNLMEEAIEPHIRDLQTSLIILVMEHRNRLWWDRMDESSIRDGESMDAIIKRFVN